MPVVVEGRHRRGVTGARGAAIVMRFDGYGQPMGAERRDGAWRLYVLSDDGKRRAVHDVAVPPDLEASELLTWLADIYHESASPRHPDVVRLGD
jgi:hypothetical protein